MIELTSGYSQKRFDRSKYIPAREQEEWKMINAITRDGTR